MIQVSRNLAVGPQIRADDLRNLADQGFTDVVCNRPDEEHPEDPGSAILAEIAERLGMRFHYLPIVPGQVFFQQSRELAGIVARPGTRVFAYCRSGARSSNAWSLARTLLPDSQDIPAEIP